MIGAWHARSRFPSGPEPSSRSSSPCTTRNPTSRTRSAPPYHHLSAKFSLSWKITIADNASSDRTWPIATWLRHRCRSGFHPRVPCRQSSADVRVGQPGPATASLRQWPRRGRSSVRSDHRDALGSGWLWLDPNRHGGRRADQCQCGRRTRAVPAPPAVDVQASAVNVIRCAERTVSIQAASSRIGRPSTAAELSARREDGGCSRRRAPCGSAPARSRQPCGGGS